MRLLSEIIIVFVGIVFGIEAFYPDSILNKDKMSMFLNSNRCSSSIICRVMVVVWLSIKIFSFE